MFHGIFSSYDPHLANVRDAYIWIISIKQTHKKVSFTVPTYQHGRYDQSMAMAQS